MPYLLEMNDANWLYCSGPSMVNSQRAKPNAVLVRYKLDLPSLEQEEPTRPHGATRVGEIWPPNESLFDGPWGGYCCNVARKKNSASVQPSSGVRNVGGFSARQVTLCCQDSQLHALVRPTCALAPKYNAVTKKLFQVQVERVAQVQ